MENTDTYLDTLISPVTDKATPEQSGFLPIIDGIDALALRLLLAQHAERSIDLQYYLIKDDTTGLALVKALLDAADRGVRVRVLVDDIFTRGYDAGLSALETHPNFEVRIINPFNRGALGRAYSSVTNFSRINRRMHNKSFTVDNRATIIGGRNIADEYFDAREDNNFNDLDVMAIGPIVHEVSAMFDLYWNHEQAQPVPAFIDPPTDIDAAMDTLRGRLTANITAIASSEYAEAVRKIMTDYFNPDLSGFEWAEYELVYDTPDKMISAEAAGDDMLGSILFEHLQTAESRLIIISPYFVPLDSGVDILSELQHRGVDISVITNSLATNNQLSVHSGYAPSRTPLLQNGIHLYEMKPDARVSSAEVFTGSGVTATLHAKTFLVDEQEVFIGSFNFDPRSAFINSEMGVLIYSPELAQHFSEASGASRLEKNTYTLFLNQDGKLRWRAINSNNEEVIYDKEPGTSWFQRFKVGFIGLFPIKHQL